MMRRYAPDAVKDNWAKLFAQDYQDLCEELLGLEAIYRESGGESEAMAERLGEILDKEI